MASKHFQSFPITADNSMLFIYIPFSKAQNEPRTSCSVKTGQLLPGLRQKRFFSLRTTCYSPGSSTMMSLDPGTQCVAEANGAAHWDLSNKANANRCALIFIYVYTVIYVCVNCAGYQLFSSATRVVDFIIDKM